MSDTSPATPATDDGPTYTVTLDLEEIWGLRTEGTGSNERDLTTPLDAAREFLRMVREDGHMYVYLVRDEETGREWLVDLGTGTERLIKGGR